MSQRVTSRSFRPARIRTRAAVLVAGFGASVALGAGVATAADTTTTGVTGTAQAQQAAKKAASWVDPVKKYKLSASFAANGGMWASKHSGQDYAIPTGTPVLATHGGTVVKAGPNGAGDGPAYGNAVVIKHGSKTYSQYAHLSKVNVKIGQVVKTGQKIALSGNTGNSSGPHLHFEIRTTPNYGSAVDPVKFLRAKGVRL
ncbi:M23 family metallopeptidase [Streptomyces sp. enrichment culture]|uniref:M23 family metallopeptidase n=1 Tax=Streptomyces sp. enrichment culture TaxID=1795815 RepID=UPI003F556CEE